MDRSQADLRSHGMKNAIRRDKWINKVIKWNLRSQIWLRFALGIGSAVHVESPWALGLGKSWS